MLNDCNTPRMDCLSRSIAQSAQASRESVFVLQELIQVIDERFTDYECLRLRGAENGISGGLIRRTILKT